MFVNKEEKKKDKVFLNSPIKNTEEDWIGISTYMKKLDTPII